LCAAAALARAATLGADPRPGADATAGASDPDSRLDPLQPDFNLAALPTTLRMPQNKLAFRVTHRFTRSLGAATSAICERLLRLRLGAQIGSSSATACCRARRSASPDERSTIEIFGQQSLLQQKPDGHPLRLDVIATLEGRNNMRASTPSAVHSRRKKRRSSRRCTPEPIFVVQHQSGDRDDRRRTDTMMLGWGARVRIRPSVLPSGVYAAVSGYTPGVRQGSVGIELRSGGHRSR
jgi:hypothetical protein